MQFTDDVKQVLIDYFNEANDAGSIYYNGYRGETVSLLECGVTFFQMMSKEYYGRMPINNRTLELAYLWSEGSHKVVGGSINVINDPDKITAFHIYLNDIFSNPYKHTTEFANATKELLNEKENIGGIN